MARVCESDVLVYVCKSDVMTRVCESDVLVYVCESLVMTHVRVLDTGIVLSVMVKNCIKRKSEKYAVNPSRKKLHKAQIRKICS